MQEGIHTPMLQLRASRLQSWILGLLFEKAMFACDRHHQVQPHFPIPGKQILPSLGNAQIFKATPFFTLAR